MEQQDQSNSIEMALQEYKEGVGEFTKALPSIAKKYNAFTEACFEEGVLSKKEKQMIALGIAVASQDEYCIIYHTKGCLDHGCSEDEILDILGVTAAFTVGASASQAVILVQEAISQFGSNQNHLQ